MKNALILHGAANNSSGNWFPWLKKELENRDFKVWVPDLPNSGHPKQKEWLETVFSSEGWEFNPDSILIGHSTGATLILRILERLPKGVKVDKSILVAGPIDKGKNFNQLKEGVTEGLFNWEKIRNSCKEFCLIYSDNDPYDCGLRHGEIIKEKVNGRLMIKKEEGHFNLEAGKKYKQFPLLLEYI